MLASLSISTHWAAWALGSQDGGGNRTEDAGGGRKAPKEGLMGHQRAIFPVAHCLFWLSFVMLILRKVKGHTDIV